MPYAFTEQDAIMAAMVLNSPQAVQMSVTVVRAFVKLRHMSARSPPWKTSPTPSSAMSSKPSSNS